MKPAPLPISRLRRLGAASLLMLGLSSASAVAEPQWARAGKPEAPVDVRWVETGHEGRVSVEVVPAIDYDGLELQLLLPGISGPPRPMKLSGGGRGEPRRAAWLLAAPPAVTPRLLVILDIDGHRLGRTVSAPTGLLPDRPRGKTTPAPGDDGVIEMRAEQTRASAQGRESPSE